MRRIFILLIILIASYEAFQLNLGLKQKQALKANLNEIINETSSVQAQLKEAKDTVDLLGQEITDLKKSLQQKEREKVEFQNQIEDAKESARDFSEKLLKDKADIEKINKELKLTKDKKEDLEKLNAKLNISLQDLTEKLKLVRSSVDDKAIILSESKLTQLLKAWDEKERQFNILKTRLEETGKKYDSLFSEHKLLEDKVKELAQAKKQLSEQAKLVSSLEKSLELLGDSLTQKELELRNRIKEVSVLKNEIFTLQAMLSSLGKAREDFDEAPDKEKAESLKRKIEVILQNAQN